MNRNLVLVLVLAVVAICVCVVNTKSEKDFFGIDDILKEAKRLAHSQDPVHLAGTNSSGRSWTATDDFAYRQVLDRGRNAYYCTVKDHRCPPNNWCAAYAHPGLSNRPIPVLGMTDKFYCMT